MQLTLKEIPENFIATSRKLRQHRMANYTQKKQATQRISEDLYANTHEDAKKTF